MDSIIRQQYTCSQRSNGPKSKDFLQMIEEDLIYYCSAHWISFHIVSITENVHIETKVRNSTSKAILFEIDKITNKKCGWQNLNPPKFSDVRTYANEGRCAFQF